MLNENKVVLIVVMVICNIFMVDLSSDIYSPAIPLIQKEFGCSVLLMEISIAVNIICIGLSSLFYGYWGDKIGRKQISLIGICIFILGLLFCLISKGINLFILGRIIQGIGAGFAFTIGLSIIRDYFQGERYIKVASMIGACLLFVPIVAPILGGVLTTYWSWRATILLLILLALFSLFFTLFLYKETFIIIPKPNNMVLINKFKYLIKNKRFMYYVVINSGATAGVWILINFLPYILQLNYNKSILNYGLSMALTLLAGMLGAAINVKAIDFLSSKSILYGSLTLAVISSVLIMLSNQITGSFMSLLFFVSLYFLQ